jgi:type VI secretion system protein ImpC
MPGGLKFDFTFSGAAATRRDPESPLRILVVGDFSGKERDAGADLAKRAVLPLDLDAFERTLARVAPRVSLPAHGDNSPVMVSFGALDHFHPDHLYGALEQFRHLRELRARLRDPATFDAASAELRAHAPVSTATAPSAISTDDDTETIGRLLGRPAGARCASAPVSGKADIQSLIRNLVAPHVVSNDMPFQEQYVAAVDATASEQMRELLHLPAFQSLEAAWRGVRTLVDSLDLDGPVKLEIADISQEELRADLERAGGQAGETGFYRLLQSRAQAAPGPQPWSLIVGLYSFRNDDADLSLLGSIGAAAAHNGSPFLAAASLDIVGCTSIDGLAEPSGWKAADDKGSANWRAMRSAPFASAIGLVLPRFLVRLPYGERTEAIEQFAFEELAQPRQHEHLLWGNSALACALLIGRTFMESGWDMEPGSDLQIDDLPALMLDSEGERRLQAGAETFLGERAAQAALERGVMTFLSHRDRNAIRLARFQSIAHPPAPLAGAWGDGT